jgi:hypothetical protein
MAVTPCLARCNPIQNVGVDFVPFVNFGPQRSGGLASVSSEDVFFPHALRTTSQTKAVILFSEWSAAISVSASLAGAPELASKHPYA